MNKKDKALYGLATFIIIVLNVLMLTIFKSDDPETMFANVVVIILAVFMFRLVWKFGQNVDRRKVKPERFGIWGVAFSSLIWFINRIDQTVIPEAVNYIFLIAILCLGTFFIYISIVRNVKRKDDKEKDDTQ